MNARPRFGPMAMVRDRFQWGSYGFIGGLLLGVILGWIFQGVVSWIFRFGLVLLLVIPLVALFLAWRRFADRDQQDADDDRAARVDETYVIEARAEPVVERRREPLAEPRER